MTGFLLNENNDIYVSGGTLAIGTIDPQCAELIIGASKGEVRQVPTLGGELKKQLGGELPDRLWCSIVKQQCQDQKLAVKDIVQGNKEILVVMQ